MAQRKSHFLSTSSNMDISGPLREIQDLAKKRNLRTNYPDYVISFELNKLATERKTNPFFKEELNHIITLTYQFVKANPTYYFKNSKGTSTIINRIGDLNDHLPNDHIVFIFSTLLNTLADLTLLPTSIVGALKRFTKLVETGKYPELALHADTIPKLLNKLAELNAEPAEIAQVISYLTSLAERGKCPNLGFSFGKLLSKLADLNLDPQIIKIIFTSIEQLLLTNNCPDLFNYGDAIAKILSKQADSNPPIAEIEFSFHLIDHLAEKKCVNFSYCGDAVTHLLNKLSTLPASAKSIGKIIFHLGGIANLGQCPDLANCEQAFGMLLNQFANQEFKFLNAENLLGGINKLVHANVCPDLSNYGDAFAKILMKTTQLILDQQSLLKLIVRIGKLADANKCPDLSSHPLAISAILDKLVNFNPSAESIRKAFYALTILMEKEKCPDCTNCIAILKLLDQLSNQNLTLLDMDNVFWSLNKLVEKGKCPDLVNEGKTIGKLLSKLCDLDIQSHQLIGILYRLAQAGNCPDLIDQSETFGKLLNKIANSEMTKTHVPIAKQINMLVASLIKLSEANKCPDLSHYGEACNKILKKGIDESSKATEIVSTFSNITKLGPHCPDLSSYDDMLCGLLAKLNELKSPPFEIITALFGFVKLAEEGKCPNLAKGKESLGKLLNRFITLEPNPHLTVSLLFALGKLAEAGKCPDLTQYDGVITALVKQLENSNLTFQEIANTLFAISKLTSARVSHSFITAHESLTKLAEMLQQDITSGKMTEISHVCQLHHYYAQCLTNINIEDPAKINKINTNYQLLTDILEMYKPASSSSHMIYHQQLLDTLKNNEKLSGLNIQVDIEKPEAGYHLDTVLLFKNKKIVIEINGPHHFDRNGQLTIPSKQRQKLLEKFGWQVIDFKIETYGTVAELIERVKEHIIKKVIPLLLNENSLVQNETPFVKIDLNRNLFGNKNQPSSPKSDNKNSNSNNPYAPF